jgi:hypothetical protein
MNPTASPIRRRAIRAALAAAAVVLVAVPATASARTHCLKGEFCLFSELKRQGGLYHFSGSDSNLGNNVFENLRPNELVGNSGRSARNRGTNVRSRLVDVAVYTQKNYGGVAGCVRQGHAGSLLDGLTDWHGPSEFDRGFANNVESYRWVRRAYCNKIGSALEFG